MAHDLKSIPEFARPWAERCLANTPIVSDEDVRNVGDWLAALAVEKPHLVKNPGRLVRMNWDQAMEAQRKWHDGLAARSARLIAQKKGFGGSPDDVETVLDLGGGFRWVRIISPAGLDYEGNAMGHCVGQGGYDEDCTILSLRDADNLPHATVQWDWKARIVQQVQGRANQQVIERYHGMVRSLVDHLHPSEVRGAVKFGHIFVAVNEKPARLMSWQELRDGDRIAGNLSLAGCTALTILPGGLKVGGSLYLSGCTSLTHLPDGMMGKGSLYLGDCTSLTHLPDGLEVDDHLFLNGCTSLTHLPEGLKVACNLYLSGCTSLTHLTDGLVVMGHLDLRGCASLTHLPERMKVGGDTILPSGQRVRSLDEARDWFAERFPTEAPAPCLT